MTDEERRLAWIATATSVDQLRSTMRNAKGKSEPVHRAALERLVEVSASDHLGPVAKDCWRMVYTVEEVRRDLGKTWRMSRLRTKIAKEGEQIALEYCARVRTDGFEEVLSYGLPRLTAEAIVLKHPSAFPAATLQIARDRLIEAGIELDNLLSQDKS